MAYEARNIKDRIAVDDDCFILEPLTDGRTRLIPAPSDVIEGGTNLNKAFFQLTEDRIILLLNSLFNDISSNPFYLSLDSLTGVSVKGVWNEEAQRIEC